MHKMISHSIRYNLLVGWTTFCLQTFNSLWHRFSKELETFLRFWCWHDSITPLLQTCGLLEAVRFGDCGCHLSWTHCHALSFVTRPVMEAAIWGWVHSSYKDQVDGFYDAQLVQRSPKCVKKISSASVYHDHHHMPEPFKQGELSCVFILFYGKFWPCHCSRTRDSSDQAPFFFNLLLSNFGATVWIWASVSDLSWSL